MLRHAVCFVVSLALCYRTAAAEPAAIAPYLADDVSSVVYLDLDKFNLSAVAKEMERLKLIPDDHLESSKRESVAIQAIYDELPKLGARRAYLLIRVSDFFQGGPALVIEVADKSQSQAVADWLKPWAEKMQALGDVAAYLPKEFEADGALVIGAASRERIQAIQASRDESPRQEAIDALAALGHDDAGWVAFGDANSRRVVREMFPQLPAPFMEIDGKLLADGVRSVGVSLKLPPDLQVSLIVDGANAEVAATLEQSVGKAMVMTKAFLLKEIIDGPPMHQERAKSLLPLLSLATPKVEGTRLSLTFGDDEQEVALMRNFLPAMTQRMRDEAYRNSRMSQFKQISLGMLNHESARKSYPAAASYDANGRPLLSWRVQILPYMEQGELWKKFRLNEPWDSEHNRKLIDQMPDVYTDPDPAVRAAIGDKGRTTYVVPVGEGLMFGGKEGMKIKDVIDGTSCTILAVEVVPERAIVWTKPDDWEVDLANPLLGVERKDREGFVAAWCDGSAHFMGNSNDPAIMKSLLTPAGGEIVNYNDVK